MDWAIVVLSSALTLATAVLAWFTWGLWRETKAARQPRLVASIDLLPPNHGELRIVNAGTGSALAVSITFGLEGGEQRRWAESVVLQNDARNFHLMSEDDESRNPDVKGLNAVVGAFPTMTVDGNYEDVRGEDYVIQQALDIRAWWQDAKNSRQLAAFRGPLLPFHESLQSIKDSLKKIADRQ
ncbi:MAG: hypothetical protein ACC645_28320 [Pirellulales bacterium]